ncbi:peptide chain release factor N(5)-glutamine methyltransferase [uncultured Ilumatobacter sp.]|uniref:peptide chain release factor N(5)-glutamine methyltransferase n=1 Tax=uncultured Ilumatobacter sp. TaxID=879968 RepID=UPI00374ECC85|tara:strand:- start:153 stop:1019 length:867 start_codon:yes stop_codon:yes gene_type:complete
MSEHTDVTVTWRGLWDETASVIGDRQHARWMCETASSTDPEEFLAGLDQTPMARMVSHLDAMVARYQTGEPLQYVLGSWSFRRLDLNVDKRVLIPRPETELVAEVAISLALAFNDERTVVDLGTGSGAIGLACADELPLDGTTVWLTDASSDALDVARANLAGVGRAARNVRVALGNWFAALPDDLEADVIVSNPPYVAVGSVDLETNVGEWEPKDALFAGADGLNDYRVIIPGAIDYLRPDGWLVLEIGYDQGSAVSALFEQQGYRKIEVRQDFAKLDRIVFAKRPA